MINTQVPPKTWSKLVRGAETVSGCLWLLKRTTQAEDQGSTVTKTLQQSFVRLDPHSFAESGLKLIFVYNESQGFLVKPGSLEASFNKRIW